MAEKSRKGDNLYTCSIVALNPDTGKLVWYFQPSPHDVHDWDAVETPVLVDGTIDGQPRKLVVQASRNGYFFVLDRATGKQILTKPFIDTLNWAKKDLDAKGQPMPDPAKYPDDRRCAGFARLGRRHELAGAELQSGHRPVLRQLQPFLQHVLSDRPRPPSAGLGRPRFRRRQRRVGAAGHRLPDGENRLEARVARRRRPVAHALHGGQAAVHAATGRTSSPSTRRTGRSSGTRR